MSPEEFKIKLEEVFSKCKDGYRLYNESVAFNKAVTSLILGEDICQIVEELCQIIQYQEEKILTLIMEKPFPVRINVDYSEKDNL